MRCTASLIMLCVACPSSIPNDCYTSGVDGQLRDYDPSTPGQVITALNVDVQSWSALFHSENFL